MKRIFLLAVLIIAAAGAKAQVIKAGGVTVSTKGVTVNTHESTTRGGRTTTQRTEERRTAASTVITGDNNVKTMGIKGGLVVIESSNSVITLNGSASELMVNCDNNKVTIGRVDRITGSGSNNAVHYGGTNNTRKSPLVSMRGDNNLVQGR